ncbi:MAG: phenylpropionate dioxygenase-like ring-hydroxylating dioxygenase large terminal subunit [Candidatus Poriferisodalaceae bacterium]|jgi:phenylpropionate dioxygenase-like ring-hydroxylating dioxygenase large terminal subunit
MAVVEGEEPNVEGPIWARNAWYHAAWANELGSAVPLARTILGEEVVLFRALDGSAAALEDRCAHRATPLRLGEVTELGLQCGYHGVTFSGDGACVHIPGQETIPAPMCVRSYPIVERQEIVWIWMGAPELADETKLLVDYPWLDDHEAWPHIHDMYEVGCSYRLLIDNLMDLTHIPFIHRNTIGGGSTKGQIEATMDVNPTETGVHYIRWMENIQPPPTYVKGAGFADDVMVDRWQEFEFMLPSTVVQWTGALPVGMGAKDDRAQDGGFQLRLYHGVTPRTETSCYYFWTPLNGYNPGDEEATKTLHKEIAFTFDEDLEFLEGQQKTIAANPNGKLVNTRHDKALIQSNRAIQDMIDRGGQ